MKETFFKSALTEDEILNSFKGTDFFESLVSGLEEALSFERGEKTAGTLSDNVDISGGDTGK